MLREYIRGRNTMRLFSLLPMILAAIFFAGSVSADHYCAKSKSLGGKIYKVCKSWRVDQGGPMPTNLMQTCRDMMCEISEEECGFSHNSGLFDGDCVTSTVRNIAKRQLGYW